MNKKTTEILKYTISILCVYGIINFFRNIFLRPIFYDVFFVEKKNIICVIAPYYSYRGFLKTVCTFISSDGSIASSVPKIINDPDKSCLIVVYDIPPTSIGDFTYKILRGSTVFYSGVREVTQIKRKYTLSITTLFKYEVDFLKEWLEYHLSVGVEHFYLYENNIKADIKIAEILIPYIERGIVTHILWPYPYEFYNYNLRKFWPNDAHVYTQLPQINHALYKFSDETVWLLCCDIDEYFYSPSHDKLNQVIARINEKNDISSIRISGTWFGGNIFDVEKAKIDGVLKTFVRSERATSSSCKCVFNTDEVLFASIHNSILHEKKEYNVPADILLFNHYRALGWKRRLDESFAREIENKKIINIDQYTAQS